MTEQTYWAWWDNKLEEYRCVYKRRFVVENCSPDGFKKWEADGKGRIVEVQIVEVKDDDITD